MVQMESRGTLALKVKMEKMVQGDYPGLLVLQESVDQEEQEDQQAHLAQ